MFTVTSVPCEQVEMCGSLVVCAANIFKLKQLTYSFCQMSSLCFQLSGAFHYY